MHWKDNYISWKYFHTRFCSDCVCSVSGRTRSWVRRNCSKLCFISRPYPFLALVYAWL